MFKLTVIRINLNKLINIKKKKNYFRSNENERDNFFNVFTKRDLTARCRKYLGIFILNIKIQCHERITVLLVVNVLYTVLLKKHAIKIIFIVCLLFASSI